MRASSPNVEAASPVAAVEVYLLAKAEALFGAVATLGRRDDAEALHKMRVSSRRLRVGLRFFAALFEARELREMQRQLRRVTQELGEIRAVDVNRQLLRKLTPKLPPATVAARAALEEALLVERARRAAELRQLLRMLAASQIGERIERVITHGRCVDGKRLLKRAQAELNDLRRTVKRRLAEWERRGGSRAFHKLRIAVKQYRYGLETAAAVFTVDAGGRVRGAEQLQDLMGDCHDVEVLLACCRQQKQTTAALETSMTAMRKFLKREHTRRYEQVEQFLAGERQWLKKVKLRASHE